jgi:hypothetical protein
MGEENPSREEERRMLAMFEQAALNDYPNPDRVGCPGAAFLQRLARNHGSIPITHPDLTHVARCSPCFREFSEFRRQAAQRSKQLRRAIAAAIIVVAGGSAVFFAARPVTTWFAGNAQGEYAAVNLDMKNLSNVRGLDQPTIAPGRDSLHLPRKRVAVRITLPFASQPGQYEVQIMRDGGNPLVLGAGQAHLENGETILPVKMDLSHLSAGNYHISIRRVPLDWVDNPVLIK